MGKLKIVLSGIFYPCAILKYFLHALRAREDVELFTVGPYTGDRIPWGNQYRFPKYASPPDLQVPNTHRPSLAADALVPQLPWTPDLWIQIDAGFYIEPKFPCPNVIVATDPHCLDYTNQRRIATHFFNMQNVYCKPGDIYLPYAYDPRAHFPVLAENNYDVMLLGLQYRERVMVMAEMARRGWRVFSELGYIFDEARELYAQAHIILNWSSRLDTVARVWEAMAFKKLLVTNRTPDLDLQQFTEGYHYLGFDTQEEAIEKMEWALENPEAMQEIANLGNKRVQGKTYDARVQQILEVCGLA